MDPAIVALLIAAVAAAAILYLAANGSKRTPGWALAVAILSLVVALLAAGGIWITRFLVN